MNFSIRSKRVLIDGRFVKAVIRIENGRIVKIDDYESSSVCDYGNLIVSPGFYDIHTHGCFGCDANHPDDLLKWEEEITKEGVCGFLPTIYTAPESETINAVSLISKQMAGQARDAKVLGIHMEGPFISEDYCGAQNREYIQSPSIESFKKLTSLNSESIRNVTIAPEKDKGHSLILYLKNKGIHVSLGHSGADLEETQKALSDGAECFTHTFNGMRKFSHHSPSILDAALISEAYSEIIADLKHVSSSALNLFIRCKRKDRVILVSDSLKIKGLPYETSFDFGRHRVYSKKDGGCYIEGTDTLAGSTLKINEAIRNIIAVCGVKMEDALAMSSANPMDYLGINDRGRIREGNVADIVVIDDDINVIATYCEGKMTFRKGE